MEAKGSIGVKTLKILFNNEFLNKYMYILKISICPIVIRFSTVLINFEDLILKIITDGSRYEVSHKFNAQISVVFNITNLLSFFSRKNSNSKSIFALKIGLTAFKLLISNPLLQKYSLNTVKKSRRIKNCVRLIFNK